MEKPAQLKDFLPEETEFTLSNNKVCKLRAANMEDYAWLQQKYGNEAAKITDVHKVAQIIYRLLKNKQDFSPIEIEDHDDDGYPVKVKKTGPQVLAMSMQGVADFQVAVGAMNKSLVGASEETEKALLASMEDSKKNP